MAGVPTADSVLVERLRAGDRDAFRELVLAHHAPLVRFAESFVPSRAVAEEVVQDGWLAVMAGIDRFEQRSSLRSWIYRIVANLAKTRGARERRTVPVSSLSTELAPDQPAVSPDHFAGPPGRGAWAQPVQRWEDDPEDRLGNADAFKLIGAAIALLPENQRRVFVLRDVEGFSSQEVCELLEIGEVNQRVLLHRARSKVRASLTVPMEAER